MYKLIFITIEVEPLVAISSAKESTPAPLEQAREWLSTCRNEHELCSVKRGLELPTRLVKVERSGQTLFAQLCESLSLPSDTEYVTLSHCWGKSQFLTLLEENFQQMKVSIPITSIPQVFQDAMLVTIELGFQYIWIDSLCIIQNSKGGVDWFQESPTMDRIYCNSVPDQLSSAGLRRRRFAKFGRILEAV
jgi:hypothetical protein